MKKSIEVNKQRIPKKFNTEQLTKEIASAIGVHRSEVGLSVIKYSDDTCDMTLHLPSAANTALAMSMIEKHVAEKDDHEMVEEDSLLKRFEKLERRVEALEKKGV